MASEADQPDPAVAGLPGHARRNRAAWNADADDYLAQHGMRQLTGGVGWGTWFLPESELRVLGEVAGRAILELGCGSAQWSIALARAGARPVGLDLSERQLRHAQLLGALPADREPTVRRTGSTPRPGALDDLVVPEFLPRR